MTVLGKFLTVAAFASVLAAPAAAQYPYSYPQPYPQPYPPTYPNPYPYQQPYSGNVLNDVINQLLGNRYSVSERTAVQQCAGAAVTQAAREYSYQPYGNYPYAQPYGYAQPYAQPYGYQNNIRVTAITDVERRSDGLRVRGELDSGMYANRYPNQGIARAGDLSFRCTVDYRGVVTSVRVRPNTNYRRY